MTLSWFIFWSSVTLVVYAYVLYPALIGLAARAFGRPVRREGTAPGSVSVVLAAHNEEANVGRRLRELCALVAASDLPGEVILVSDGSTDGTVGVARAACADSELVRVIELPENQGKAVALTAGCAAARYEVVVFADARQSWAPDALAGLLDDFRDPVVGAVSGDLVVGSGPGVMAGFGLYWRFEKWLREQEGLLYSTVGATGAISAVRRELFRPIPPGTILDDVYWPLWVVMQGYRVVHDSRAHAYDRLPSAPADEFRRKVRTLSGNFQLVGRIPEALVPWRNPVWVQFVSHKLARLVVPWSLLGALVTSALLPGRFYRAAFCAQAAAYLLGCAGLRGDVGARLRVAGALSSFLVLNSAAWLAFWLWASGASGRTWKKVAYEESRP